MSSVIKRDFRTFDALNFIDRVKASPTGDVEHVLHVALAKSSTWPNELIPPVPTDTKKEENDLWSSVIGFQRITPSDVTLVVPRINWEHSGRYVKFNELSDSAFSQRFYCINSLYQVFSVEEVYQTDPITVTEPIFSSTSIIDTNDGYRWKFLYDLSVVDINHTIQDEWMPINIGIKQTSKQKTYGDINAEWTLGGRGVMVTTKITDVGIPLDVSYRQLALMLDVLQNNGTDILTATNAIPSDVEINSGKFLYLENRKSIQREVGQTEEPRIVLNF